MPTYTFKNISTGKVWEETISISARDEMVKDPNIQQIIDEAPAMSYKGTRTKPDSGFRDVLNASSQSIEAPTSTHFRITSVNVEKINKKRKKNSTTKW